MTDRRREVWPTEIYLPPGSTIDPKTAWKIVESSTEVDGVPAGADPVRQPVWLAVACPNCRGRLVVQERQQARSTRRYCSNTCRTMSYKARRLEHTIDN